MQLISERLVLRPVSVQDRDMLMRIYGDPATNTFNPAGPLANLDEAQPGFSCYLKKCESSAFFYQDVFQWDSLKMSLFLLCVREPATHPRLIKLTNDDRRFLPLVRRLNILERDSVMGKLLLQRSTP